MKILIIALMILSAAFFVQAQTAKVDDSKAAAKIVEDLFAAMKAKNAAAISGLFLKEGQLVAIDRPRTGDGPSTT